jgi:hypothetical protein
MLGWKTRKLLFCTTLYREAYNSNWSSHEFSIKLNYRCILLDASLVTGGRMWVEQRAECLYILQKGHGVLERNLGIKADGKNWANNLATSVTRLNPVRGFFPLWDFIKLVVP